MINFIAEQINQKLKHIFCPTSTRHEQKLSVVIPSFLTSNCSSPLNKECVSTSENEIASAKQTKCSKTTDTASRIKELKAYIHTNLNSSQIRKLTEIGFCMQTSPNTARIAVRHEANPMSVCIGGSKPGSQETLFIPSKEQIIRDARKLQQMIGLLPTIDLVTIARSFRDGFTPREVQPFIESNIIGLLTSYAKKHNLRSKVIYDNDLMVGKEHSLCVD